jgi:hypothetical protein
MHFSFINMNKYEKLLYVFLYELTEFHSRNGENSSRKDEMETMKIHVDRFFERKISS